jgi:cytidylate kinase
MLITVSGPPGSGTSTIADRLAAELGHEHVSGGDVFRALADEEGLSLAELNARAEEDDSIDRDLDRRLRRTAIERDDVVLESRLSGWMAGEYADLRVWLDAPVSVRAERIAEREDKSPAAARAETEQREASEHARYEAYYGIDFTERSIYDLSVNTARWDEAGVLAIIAAAVERYDPETDEGAAPVEGVSYDF